MRKHWDFTKEVVAELPDGEEVVGIVRFFGYHHDAQTSGAPENCYPEEGESRFMVEDIPGITKDNPKHLTALFALESKAAKIISQGNLKIPEED